ncbi:MAG: hypothetical protein NTY38_20870 [Acidobacteria bacterium]|nr:hypothetical protein [Acidobacteriota bacterium]
MIIGRDPLPPTYAPGDVVGVTCDQNGQATMKSLAPGKYRLLVFADAPVDPANQSALFLANRVKGEELTLRPGEGRSISVHAVDRKD